MIGYFLSRAEDEQFSFALERVFVKLRWKRNEKQNGSVTSAQKSSAFPLTKKNTIVVDFSYVKI